ncbi:MAG: hypothetical protein OEY67_02085 [Gammaproteobacteria bacterium]|nr:hypothetical protein [Gammaproteobacteria bacterium]
MSTSAAEKQPVTEAFTHRHSAHPVITLSPALIKNILKTMEVAGFTAGPSVLAFNLFNFNISKLGLYYSEPAQYGIAIGVFLIALALLLRSKKNS